MYQIRGFLRFAEVDAWEDGCQPDTGTALDYNVDMEGKTVDELLNNIKEHFDVDGDAIEKNACGEKGRIDIARTENENGENASESEIKDWKAGKINLWYAIYTGLVEKTETVDLTI